MVIHADYSQPCYKQYPNFTHPKIKRIIGITKYICQMMKEKFNIDCELCYNPLVLEPKKKRIMLVSATRLSAIKGGNRMKKLAEEMDVQGLNYIWYVFTNDTDTIGSPNVIFLKPRLDVYKWIQECDGLVQVSDTEADSYSIAEALGYGKAVIVTPLPYLKEKHIEQGENAIILDFNCSNVKEVVEQIKTIHKATWNATEDGYIKYLKPSKSTYKKERKGMKRIRVKQRFKDMKCGNIIRKPGEEYTTDKERAEDLSRRGWAVVIEDITQKTEVETAVKNEKKETAVPKKEKTTKPRKGKTADATK